MHHKSTIPVAFLLPLFVAMAGCSEYEEPIVNYRVRKSDDVTKANRVAQEKAKAEKARMLAAMVIDGRTTWFFKLQGPDEKIDGQVQAFTKLIGSVKFQGKIPTWTNPAGWKQLADNHPKNKGFVPRLATILIDADDKKSPELTVTELPTAIEDGPEATKSQREDMFILINVNRWRKQLLLKPTTVETMYAVQDGVGEKPVAEVVKKLVDNRTVVFVHLQGTKPAAASGNRAPFMGR